MLEKEIRDVSLRTSACDRLAERIGFGNSQSGHLGRAPTTVRRGPTLEILQHLALVNAETTKAPLTKGEGRGEGKKVHRQTLRSFAQRKRDERIA